MCIRDRTMTDHDWPSCTCCTRGNSTHVVGLNHNLVQPHHMCCGDTTCAVGTPHVLWTHVQLGNNCKHGYWRNRLRTIFRCLPTDSPWKTGASIFLDLIFDLQICKFPISGRICKFPISGRICKPPKIPKITKWASEDRNSLSLERICSIFRTPLI